LFKTGTCKGRPSRIFSTQSMATVGLLLLRARNPRITWENNVSYSRKKLSRISKKGKLKTPRTLLKWNSSQKCNQELSRRFCIKVPRRSFVQLQRVKIAPENVLPLPLGGPTLLGSADLRALGWEGHPNQKILTSNYWISYPSKTRSKKWLWAKRTLTHKTHYHQGLQITAKLRSTSRNTKRKRKSNKK